MNKKIKAIVEIGEKPIIERRASATGIVSLSKQSFEAINNGSVAKGDVIQASTIAVIQAVKRCMYTIFEKILGLVLMVISKP